MSMVWRTSTRSTGSTRFRLKWKPGPFMEISLRGHCDMCLSGPRLYRQELLDDWELARQGKPLNRITPLE